MVPGWLEAAVHALIGIFLGALLLGLLFAAAMVVVIVAQDLRDERRKDREARERKRNG